MTNFKSGSGNLNFDGDDGSSPPEAESATDNTAGTDVSSTGDRTTAGDSSAAGTAEHSAGETDPNSSDERSTPSTGGHDGETYPYFVRRNNVGDERDTRLEIHVRDKVADGEAEFRHALATELGATDVSKTDAREFALLAAFRHPERVAELMREEGFDSIG